jgi:hypothetical protein
VALVRFGGGNLGTGDFRVIIYEPALTGLMQRGEAPDAFGRRMNNLVFTFAVRGAPVSGRKVPWGRHPGSSHLKWSHKRSGRIGRGPRSFQYGVRNTAPYARYVHEGTSIVVARQPMMRVGKGRVRGGLWANSQELDYARGNGIVLLGNHVRGQDANPWLRTAGMRAFAAQSAFLR